MAECFHQSTVILYLVEKKRVVVVERTVNHLVSKEMTCLPLLVVPVKVEVFFSG